MKYRITEIALGIGIIIAVIFLCNFAYKTSKKVVDSVGYNYLTASFSNIDGITIGSDIKISGFKVGSITSIAIDEKTYNAILTLKISKKYKIPKDSSASVQTSGLLGGRYIGVSPGSDDSMLLDGDAILYTQSAVNLEALISKFAVGK